MTTAEIHGVHGYRPTGVALGAGQAAPVLISPGKAGMWVRARVVAGGAVERQPVGGESWTRVEPGGEFTVTADAPQRVRAAGGGGGLTFEWGPADVLAALDAYTGRRGERVAP